MLGAWLLLAGLGIVILLVAFQGRALVRALSWLGRLAFSFLIGGLLITGLDFVGLYFGLAIPLNLVTMGVAGVLGLPGLATLILFQFLF